MDGCRRIVSHLVCGDTVVGISGLCRIHQYDTCKWTEDGDNCGEPRKEKKNGYCKYHRAQVLKIQMEEEEWNEFLKWLKSLSKQYKKVFNFSILESETKKTGILSAKSQGFIGTFSHPSKHWTIEIAPKIKEVKKQAILSYQLEKSIPKEFSLVRVWDKSKELSSEEWENEDWSYLFSKIFVS